MNLKRTYAMAVLSIITGASALTTGCATAGANGGHAKTPYQARNEAYQKGRMIQGAVNGWFGGYYSKDRRVNGAVNGAVRALPGLMGTQAEIEASNEGYVEQDIYYENGEYKGSRGRGHRHTKIPASAPKPR